MFCHMASVHLQAPHNEVTYELNHDFFAVNVETGVIRLKRSLWGSSTEVFRVTFILLCLFLVGAIQVLHNVFSWILDTHP